MVNKLAERRLELGLTQPQVSEHLKTVDPRMDVGMVSRFERGACLPTTRVREALCEVLQAPDIALWRDPEVVELSDEEYAEIVSESRGLPRLLRAIPYGHENAVTRSKLVWLLDMSDRKVRELIEQARRQGEIIINRQDGNGYYRSDDIDEMERQYRQDTSRALSILARRKTLRRRLKEAGRSV